MKPAGFNLICLSLATSLLLSSCGKETKELTLDPRTSIPTKDKQHQELHLSVTTHNKVTLRSLDTQADPLTRIQNLRLVFYNQGDNPVVQDVSDIIITSPSQLENLAVKLHADNYQLVAIANPTPKFINLTLKGAPLSNITAAITSKTTDYYSQAENLASSVVLFNDQGIINISKAQFSSKENISIKLEASLARVFVYGTPSIKGGILKSNKPASFFIAGLANQGYHLRQLASLASGSLEVLGDNTEQASHYAKSPIWDIWKTSIPSTTEGINHYTERMRLAGQEVPWKLVLNSDRELSSKMADAMYLTKESTIPSAELALMGTTPYVLVRYPYVPQGLTLEDNEGWLRYQGKLYTETQAKELLKNEQATQDPLKIAMSEDQITETSFVRGFISSKHKIEFYKDGYSYYTVYIKHFTPEQSPNGYGRYGIVRGNEYRIHIQSIQRAGMPIPPDYTNNLTPITERINSALNATALSVVSHTQEEEL